MPSVVGVLEQRELTARRRVDALREGADRIQAELVAAEREWNEWVIARSRVDQVLSPGEGDTVGPDVAEETSDRGEPPALPASSKAAKLKSVVPMWRAVWPGRHCRRTTSASCRCSRTGAGSVRAR
ncbi:hypothetical protein QD712_24940 [Streptomyces acidiscabies]